MKRAVVLTILLVFAASVVAVHAQEASTGPDLVIEDIFPIDIRERTRIRCRIRNQGDMGISGPLCGWYDIGIRPLRIWIDGEYRTDTPTWNINLLPGETHEVTDHFLGWSCSGESDEITICCDHHQVLAEADKNNNCRTERWDCGTLTQTNLAPDGPDFVIEDFSLRSPGSSFIDVTVRNQGGLPTINVNPSGLWVDGVYQRTSSSWGTDLRPGGVHNESFSGWSCSGEGDTITICADVEGVQVELNESNNCRTEYWDCATLESTLVEPALKPDFVISSFSRTGENIMHYTVKNEGNLKSRLFSPVRIWVNDEIERSAGSYAAGLSPGATREGRFSINDLWLCRGGYYKVSVCADTTSQIDELNETNNCWTETFTCVSADLDSDGDVDIFDLVIAGNSFGKSLGDADYDPRADTNGDGVVDILDLIAVGSRFGETG